MLSQVINSTLWIHVGAASSRDKRALDDATSRQDAAPTSIFQGYFSQNQKKCIIKIGYAIKVNVFNKR